jgi:hypothetical protein
MLPLLRARDEAVHAVAAPVPHLEVPERSLVDDGQSGRAAGVEPAEPADA